MTKPKDTDDRVQEIADRAAEEVGALTDYEEEIEVTITESPSVGSFIAARSRIVQSGSETFQLVEGEPVEIPEGLEDSWVEYGWVQPAE